MRRSFALLALALAGCSYGNNTDKPPTSDSLPPVPVSKANDNHSPMPPAPATAEATAPLAADGLTWPIPFKASYTGCTRVATRAATILSRPVAGAGKFGQLAVGDKVMLLARTADGWVGFDPQSAQAGNVGIFRLRWVQATAAFAPGDSCQQVPLVQAPPLGCLLMAARDTPVHPRPAPGTARLGTIPAGSYAQVVKASVGPDHWAEVQVPGSTAHGYVAQSDINFNGDCQ